MSLIFLCNLLICAIAVRAQDYPAGPYVFTIKNLPNAKIAVSSTELKKGLTEVTFKLNNTQPLPKELNITWSVPLVGISGSWTTNSNDARFIRMGSNIQSNLASHAPVMAMFGPNNINGLTFALSDAFHQVTLSAGVNEEDARLNCSATITLTNDEKNNGYQLSILLDNRPVTYYEALKQVTNWWAQMPAYKPATVPAAAKLPVYSTWYSYHQKFTEKELLNECIQAKAIGYETIIVDDGWQTLNSARGYGYTGDWKPERIPDMAGFVKKVHQTGMKFMLWYSVPFMGYHAGAYERFKGKYLYQSDRISAGVLDPRYPQVRKFIVDRYLHDLKEWNLDGFKLDFIDSFTNRTDEPPAVSKEADFTSLYAGVDQLMVDIKKALTAVKPDILIEFRQSYTGPAMRKYGNMFRAGDCPAAAITNRVRTTDIKLMAGTTAVHSDMLTWNYKEQVNIAALQLLNIMFSVPQLSVRLSDLPQAHLNMVKFYTRYWLANKELLLDGNFEAFNPELNYPVLMSVKGNKIIAGLYADALVTVSDDFENLDIINVKTTGSVLLKLNAASVSKVTIFNCEGKKVSSSTMKLKQGINHLQAPPSGLITIQQLSTSKKSAVE